MKEGTHRKIVLALLGLTLLACGKTGQPPSAEHQANNEVLAIEQTNDQEARWFNEERQWKVEEKKILDDMMSRRRDSELPQTVNGTSAIGEKGSGEGASGASNDFLNKPRRIEVYATDVGPIPSVLSTMPMLEVCSAEACHPVILRRDIGTLTRNDEGQASLIGVAEMPVTRIERIRLHVQTGSGREETAELDEIALVRPLPLLKVAPGARVFIGLQTQSACSHASCVRLDSADAVWLLGHEGSQHSFYNPRTALDRNLGSGVQIHLPAGMVQGVRIVTTSVRKQKSIYPDVIFKIEGPVIKNGIVRIRPNINKDASRQGKDKLAQEDEMDRMVEVGAGGVRILNGNAIENGNGIDYSKKGLGDIR